MLHKKYNVYSVLTQLDNLHNAISVGTRWSGNVGPAPYCGGLTSRGIYDFEAQKQTQPLSIIAA